MAADSLTREEKRKIGKDMKEDSSGVATINDPTVGTGSNGKVSSEAETNESVGTTETPPKSTKTDGKSASKVSWSEAGDRGEGPNGCDEGGKVRKKQKKNGSYGAGKGWKTKKKNGNEGNGKDKKAKNFRKWKQSEEEIQSLKPHAGSYASPVMRKLLGLSEEKPPETPNCREHSEENGDGGEIDTAEGILIDVIGNKGNNGAMEEKKAPKKKVAFFVGFLGQNYGGMQINEGHKTIQAEIEYALHRAGFLGDSTNFGYPHKYSWSSAARTDKGVHSCAQVCSAKIRFDCATDEVRTRLNDLLPDDIRVLDVVKTTRNFCAHTARDKVRYQYMLPSFLLMESSEVRTIFKKIGNFANEMEERGYSDPLSKEEKKALYDAFVTFRATQEQVARLKAALHEYVGTQSYHNYTRRLTHEDMSSRRYIMSFDVSDPVVSDYDGMEWIPTHVLGQSFLLNQIRKMISVAVDVARGSVTLKQMRDSFTERKMKTGVAPAQGLFLDMSYFDHYNRRNGDKNNNLDWYSPDADADTVKRWKEFRDCRVVPHIQNEEGKEHNFITYLYLHEFNFDFSSFQALKEEETTGREEKENDGA